MFPFRGDAHKIYVQLKQEKDLPSNKMLKEASEIKAFYESVDSTTLQLIYFRMVKEKNGMGIIPILVSGIPWLLFLFASKIQDALFKNGSKLWLTFSIIYLIILTISTFLHFREKAWANLHIEIIKNVLQTKGALPAQP